MLSVLILTAVSDSPLEVAAISRSLAVLVPHAVDGRVRDVHILAQTPSTALMHLAEDAGAEVHTSLLAVEAALKSVCILVLQPGILAGFSVMEEIWQRGLAAPGAPEAVVKLASRGWSGGALWQALFPRAGAALVSLQTLSKLEKPEFTALLRLLKAPLHLKATLQAAF